MEKVTEVISESGCGPNRLNAAGNGVSRRTCPLKRPANPWFHDFQKVYTFCTNRDARMSLGCV